MVSVPAEARYVHILRAVVASSAAGLDFSVDAIEDLRLVLDEACGQVLEMSKGAQVLVLEIGQVDHCLELAVHSDGTPVRLPAEDESMAWTILTALADELELQNGQNPRIRLTKSSRRE